VDRERSLSFFFDKFGKIVKISTIYVKVIVFGKSWPCYHVPHRSDFVKKSNYAVVLQSQLGPRTGELTIQEETEVVSGYFSLLGCRTGFSGRVLEPGKYLISGALRAAGDKDPYDAIFRVENGHLSGGLITRHGCWDLTGLRMAPASRQREKR
jgi:hypothetical protein